MMKNKKTRLMACCLALLVLFQAAVPTAMAVEESGKNIIHIKTADDWADLATNCRLDAWSNGVTVVLDNDLTLTEEVVIPTFGGVMDGQGHTIQGLSITREGDHQGLFRYLREGAVIQNLTVSGSVTPGGKSSVIGGIVGSNSGTVMNCRFEGFVSGKGTVGGLVGCNETEGRIEQSEMVSGGVSGEHFTGGVVGENRGAVISCVNRGQINTQAVEPDAQLEDVDWSQLNRAENLPTCTDTGGVAGFSAGLLQSCTNHGLVGYPHLGYNVGGVAGRQSGQMVDCVNHSEVRGRKDVGGIVGQAEPYTQLRYQEDTLQQLAHELDTMNSLLGNTLDSTDDTRQAIFDHLSAINGQAGSAREDISALLDHLENFGDDTVDVANDLSARIQRFLDDLPGAGRDLEDAADRLSDALIQLKRAMGQAGQVPDQVQAVLKQLEDALRTLQQALRTLLTGVPMPLQPGMKLEEILHILSLLGAIIQEVPNSVEQANEAWLQFQAALDKAGLAGGSVENAIKQMENAMELLSHSADHLSDAFRELRRAVEVQSDLPTLELPKLPADFHETEDALRENLAALNEEMKQMNQTVLHGGDTLSDHLQQINRQFRAVTDVIRRAGEGVKDPELVVDLSEEDLNENAGGRLQDCRNHGAIDGDVNVGGIVGAMAIEFDFDPEDDAHTTGSRSLRFQYLTRAVTHSCVNRGTVTARKDSVGGVVGRMDLGVVWGSQNYGAVESTSGQQVGGIAGYSDGVIAQSWAKCALTGQSRVGGIAGRGMDIRDCRSMVKIEEPGAWCGAIAGEAAGSLRNNLFLSADLGGVDGISYQGKAAPLSAKDFMTLPGLPEPFTRLWVRFTSNGRLVKSVAVSYGEVLDEVPAVPERPCCYGSWDWDSTQPVVFDLDVSAVYTPWLTTASSPDGNILAEGSFRPETVLTVEERTEGDELGHWLVSLPEGEQAFTALRVKTPDHHTELYILDDSGTWQALPSHREGSYLRAELTGTQAEISLRKAAPYPIVMAVVLGVPLMLLVCFVIWHRKKQGVQPAIPEKQTEDTTVKQD